MVYALLCFAVVCYRSNSLKWRHSERDGVSNHQHHDCLSNGLFRRKSKKTSAALVFVWGIHRWPVNSPHKGPVTRKMFPYDDVIMLWIIRMTSQTLWQSSYQKMVVNVATNYNTESRFSSVINFDLWLLSAISTDVVAIYFAFALGQLIHTMMNYLVNLITLHVVSQN